MPGKRYPSLPREMLETRKRLILLVFTIITGLTLIELLLTALDIPHFYRAHSHPVQFAFFPSSDGGFKYLNVPSERIRFVYDGDPRGYFHPGNIVVHQTNSLGFRGPEFSPTKSEKAIRIAFLGDSFTFGEGVHFSDTFSEKVAVMLNEKFSAQGLHSESYNFGVGGYNTADSLWLLRNIVLDYQPDIIVLGYTLNDAEPPLFELDPLTRNITRRAREFDVTEGLSDSQPPHKRIYKSRLASLVWQVGAKYRLTGKTIAHYQSLYRKNSPGWRDSQQALAGIIDLCKSRDIPCLVVCFPLFYSLDNFYTFGRIHSVVGKEVKAQGGVFIDLFKDFKGVDGQKFWVYPTDQHPNELAHALAARAIVRKVLEESLSRRFGRDRTVGMSP